VIENKRVWHDENHCLAGAIADSGFHEFRRQLEYKASWYGSKVVLIDKFYPSSQLCSGCGSRQPMPLKLRQYDCSSCGLSLERDLNAAINIRDYSETAASYAVEACGRDLLGDRRKQELSIKLVMSNFKS